MAVIAIGEAPDSPKADFDFESGKVTFTRTIRVETNSLDDGPLTVANAPGLPILGSSYRFGNEFYRNARLRHFSSPKRLGDASLFWELDLEYSTPSPKDKGSGAGQDSNGQWTNPLAELADVDLSFEDHDVPITQIYNLISGVIQPIQNTAGQTFIPAPTRTESRAILTITRNEAVTANHPGLSVIYANTCNADVFWGATPGYWLCKPIHTQRQEKNMPDGSQFAYLKCTYSFHGKAPNWDLSLLDEGDYYNQGTAAPGVPPVRRAFKDNDGNPIQGALDGHGGKLTTGATPVYLTVRQYSRIAFAGLALPQSYISPNIQ